MLGSCSPEATKLEASNGFNALCYGHLYALYGFFSLSHGCNLSISFCFCLKVFKEEMAERSTVVAQKKEDLA